MAKRFFATELWGEDWFLEMPNEYKLFWFYIIAECDHAGLFKVNLRSFCGLLEVKVTPTEAIKYFNSGKERIRIISDSVWFIEDFFTFQYGPKFNSDNRVHESISKLYQKNNIELTSLRGLKGVTDGVKDKDKDKDTVLNKRDKKNGKSTKLRGSIPFIERSQRHIEEANRAREKNSKGKVK
jgi:hypothetical protein